MSPTSKISPWTLDELAAYYALMDGRPSPVVAPYFHYNEVREDVPFEPEFPQHRIVRVEPRMGNGG